MKHLLCGLLAISMPAISVRAEPYAQRRPTAGLLEIAFARAQQLKTKRSKEKVTVANVEDLYRQCRSLMEQGNYREASDKMRAAMEKADDAALREKAAGYAKEFDQFLYVQNYDAAKTAFDIINNAKVNGNKATLGADEAKFLGKLVISGDPMVIYDLEAVMSLSFPDKESAGKSELHNPQDFLLTLETKDAVRLRTPDGTFLIHGPPDIDINVKHYP